MIDYDSLRQKGETGETPFEKEASKVLDDLMVNVYTQGVRARAEIGDDESGVGWEDAKTRRDE